MRKRWYQRWNVYGYRDYARSRYWELTVIPTLVITWINHNRSLHFDLHVLFWGLKLNTFWQDEPEPQAMFSEEEVSE